MDSFIKFIENDWFYHKVIKSLVFNHLLSQIIGILSVNQIWLTTWLCGYLLESDHKTDSSGKKSVLWTDLLDYDAMYFFNVCLYLDQSVQQWDPEILLWWEDIYPRLNSSQAAMSGRTYQ